MQSPRMQWTLRLGALAVEDVLCDRGEPDGDTLSEVIREVFRVHTRPGWWTFTTALTAAGIAFHRHICKETPWLPR